MTPTVVELPKTLDDKIAYRADHLVAYQGKRWPDAIRNSVTASTMRVKEARIKGYHKLLSYKDEYEVARLLLSHP